MIIISLYHLLEKLDGEKGKAFIPYKIAERLKLWIITYLK